MPWWTILWVAMSSIAALALLFLSAYISSRWFFADHTPDEIHFAVTADGWRIAVTRYRPAAGAGAPGFDPVLLCPGPGGNRLMFDLTEKTSLARHLAAAGFDTWIVELRGRGLSTRPRLFSRYRYDWSFDEYVEHDLPAAIDAVLRATGRDRLHLVGASYGGAVCYALLGDPAWAGKVASAVTLAAPATFRSQGKYLFSWPLRNLRWLRHKFLMRLLAPLAGYRYMPSVRLLYEKENVSGEVIRRFMVNAIANFAGNELLQYGDWLAGDHFRSIDHRRDYRAAMASIRTPILLIAGNKDRIAPPRSVKDASELCGSSDKRFVIASRGQAMKANYGHLDLLIGEHAAADVYPLVKRWLAGERDKGGEGNGGAPSGFPLMIARFP